MMIVRLPGGTAVQATPLGRPDADPEPDFGLYLDQRWHATWPHVVIDWPDFGVPADPVGTVAAIRDAFDRAAKGDVVEVGCHGGIGRTGTVLACFAILDGMDADDAVSWVRSNYCPDAVETLQQEAFVSQVGALVAGEP